jgi:hypothetical protein
VRRRHVLWIGLSLYALSFFLVAVKDSLFGITMRGYECALNTLFGPWEPDAHSQGRLSFLSLLISGWINPVFLITAIFVLFSRLQAVTAVLRFVVVLMMPFCWVVFHYEGVYPREGHFVWVFGMLLVLFSRELAKRESA